MLPLAAASSALGLWQTLGGAFGLNKIGKEPIDNYTIRPETQQAFDESREMSKRGFTPEEMARAKGDIAGTANRRYTLAKDMAGGNLSRAIQGAVNYSNLGAYTQLADADSKRHQQNVMYAHSMAKYLQGETNRATAEKIRRRYAEEEAYGGAMRTGTENIANSLNLTQAMEFNKDLMGLGGGPKNITSIPTTSTDNGGGFGGRSSFYGTHGRPRMFDPYSDFTPNTEYNF